MERFCLREVLILEESLSFRNFSLRDGYTLKRGVILEEMYTVPISDLPVLVGSKVYSACPNYKGNAIRRGGGNLQWTTMLFRV